MKLKILKGKEWSKNWKLKDRIDRVAFYPENEKDIFTLGRICEKRPCQINFNDEFIVESIFMPIKSVIDIMIG